MAPVLPFIPLIVGGAQAGAAIYGSRRQAQASERAAETYGAASEKAAEAEERAAMEAIKVQREELEWERSLERQARADWEAREARLQPFRDIGAQKLAARFGRPLSQVGVAPRPMPEGFDPKDPRWRDFSYRGDEVTPTSTAPGTGGDPRMTRRLGDIGRPTVGGTPFTPFVGGQPPYGDIGQPTYGGPAGEVPDDFSWGNYQPGYQGIPEPGTIPFVPEPAYMPTAEQWAVIRSSPDAGPGGIRGPRGMSSRPSVRSEPGYVPRTPAEAAAIRAAMASVGGRPTRPSAQRPLPDRRRLLSQIAYARGGF